MIRIFDDGRNNILERAIRDLRNDQILINSKDKDLTGKIRKRLALDEVRLINSFKLEQLLELIKLEIMTVYEVIQLLENNGIDLYGVIFKGVRDKWFKLVKAEKSEFKKDFKFEISELEGFFNRVHLNDQLNTDPTIKGCRLVYSPVLKDNLLKGRSKHPDFTNDDQTHISIGLWHVHKEDVKRIQISRPKPNKSTRGRGDWLGLEDTKLNKVYGSTCYVGYAEKADHTEKSKATHFGFIFDDKTKNIFIYKIYKGQTDEFEMRAKNLVLNRS